MTIVHQISRSIGNISEKASDRSLIRRNPCEVDGSQGWIVQGPAEQKSIKTARLDPYRWSHKAIRTVLGRLLESAGRSDFGDLAAVQRFRAELEGAAMLLATHARIEVQFIDGLLAMHDAPHASHIQHEHVGLERDLHRVASGLHHVEEALGWDGEGDVREARARGHAFYLGLSRFIARTTALVLTSISPPSGCR